MKISANPWLIFQGGKMDFQVNNDTYFLSLADDEAKWLVFVDTPNGPRPVAVYEDAPSIDDEDVKVVVEDSKRRQIVN